MIWRFHMIFVTRSLYVLEPDSSARDSFLSFCVFFGRAACGLVAWDSCCLLWNVSCSVVVPETSTEHFVMHWKISTLQMAKNNWQVILIMQYNLVIATERTWNIFWKHNKTFLQTRLVSLWYIWLHSSSRQGFCLDDLRRIVLSCDPRAPDGTVSAVLWTWPACWDVVGILMQESLREWDIEAFTCLKDLERLGGPFCISYIPHILYLTCVAFYTYFAGEAPLDSTSKPLCLCQSGDFAAEKPPAMPHNLTLPCRALGSKATLTGCPWSLRRVSYLPGAENVDAK